MKTRRGGVKWKLGLVTALTGLAASGHNSSTGSNVTSFKPFSNSSKYENPLTTSRFHAPKPIETDYLHEITAALDPNTTLRFEITNKTQLIGLLENLDHKKEDKNTWTFFETNKGNKEEYATIKFFKHKFHLVFIKPAVELAKQLLGVCLAAGIFFGITSANPNILDNAQRLIEEYLETIDGYDSNTYRTRSIRSRVMQRAEPIAAQIAHQQALIAAQQAQALAAQQAQALAAQQAQALAAQQAQALAAQQPFLIAQNAAAHRPRVVKHSKSVGAGTRRVKKKWLKKSG